MPGRKATGTKTAASTSVVAITGPVICPMPRRVASTAPRSGFSSMFRCDVLDHHDGVVDDEADRQHDREQRDGVGRVAEDERTAKVPTSETGIASVGISVARQSWRKTKTTTTTMAKVIPA